ncbi:MAG: 4-(cytidine 5'-diphospho)-2-C-methyl-D-erythritol kinase [Candidatus Cryptobacteroides sp.]
MIEYPPVKINLGLNVLRKRADGFHDLETVFIESGQFHDTLEIVTGDDYSRTMAALVAKYGDRGGCCAEWAGAANEDGDIPTLAQGISEDGKMMITVARAEGVDWDVRNDLCAKAYTLLDNDFKLPPVKIFLEKLSPVGAGLGGGSADAAYTLTMLNGICSLGLTKEQLAGYAARLGSDCAFFIHGCPMFGEGRGEVLSPFELPVDIEDAVSDCASPATRDNAEEPGSARKPVYELQIVIPEGISVSTAEAYRGIIPAIPEMRLRDVLARPIEEWKDLLVNDFETTVFKAHPELAAIKQSLYDSGAVYASMSGSGSALIALYESNRDNS